MNELAKQAYEDFKRGMKYKEIAEKYGVSLSAVKSWASRYWKKEGCNPRKGKMQPKKQVATGKRGGQFGNKNAVGHGGTGPPGNKNAVKTGEFEALFFDTLKEDEKQLLCLIQLDKERLLLQEIQLLTIRERRMLKRIDDLKDFEYTVIMKKTTIENGQKNITEEERAVLGQIQAIEDALTRVQARKQRAIEALHKFGFDDTRLQLELMKIEFALSKESNNNPDMEDDGFMDAMNAAASQIWEDVCD